MGFNFSCIDIKKTNKLRFVAFQHHSHVVTETPKHYIVHCHCAIEIIMSISLIKSQINQTEADYCSHFYRQRPWQITNWFVFIALSNRIEITPQDHYCKYQWYQHDVCQAKMNKAIIRRLQKIHENEGRKI